MNDDIQFDPTSINSIMSTVRTVFPNAEVCEDSENQIVIYTGLYSVGDPSVDLVTWEEYHVPPEFRE